MTEYRRPRDEEYWCPSWSRVLFAGDLFQAIPFHRPPTEIYTAEGLEQDQHFFGEIGWSYGLLVTPTCDMYESIEPEKLAHPFRVLVPILPLADVIQHTETVEQSLGLLRARDQLSAYLYLPPLDEFLEEGVACLYRPTIVTEDFLANPPRRVAQLQPEARRHLKIKLALYWGRAKVEHDELPLTERGEDEAGSQSDPPSRYDSPQRYHG